MSNFTTILITVLLALAGSAVVWITGFLFSLGWQAAVQLTYAILGATHG